jgi:hypothetical protein
MKSNVVLYWALCAFFAIVAIMYAIWGLLGAQSGVVTMDPDQAGHVEPAGTIALGLCAVLFGFIAFYIGKTYKSQGGELPEDLDDSNIDDGDPELGHFSPWSWWPVLLAGAISLVFLGVAIGFWIAFIGVALLLITLVGWVYEYYRGYFAH